MSWLSKLTGIHIKIDLGREGKRAAQSALDALKPKVCGAIDDATKSVLSVSLNPSTIETSLRLSLHRAVGDLGLPIYAAVPISLLVDSVSLAGITGGAGSLREGVLRESERLKRQVMGARV